MAAHHTTPGKFSSPFRVFVTLLAVIFAAEAILMFLLHDLLHAGMPVWLVALLDAGLLAIACFPLLWLFLLRPLRLALSLESRKAQAIMATAAEGIITTDAQFAVQSYNRAAEKIFGYPAEEAIGSPLHWLFAPGEPVKETLGQDGANAATLQGRHKDGSFVALEVTTSHFNMEGTRQYAIMVRDVSERNAAVAALQESEQRYRMLFDGSNDAMFLHGLTSDGMPTHFFDVNEMACQRLGYSRDELLALTAGDIDAPGDQAALPNLARQLEAQQGAVFERTHVARDGRHIPVEINARLFELQGQKLVLSIARDISERKHAEEMLRLANEQMDAVFSNMQVLIAYLDSDCNFIRVNRAYAQADKKEADFFPGKNHFTLYPNTENEAIFRRVLATGTPHIELAKPFDYTEHPEWGTTYWDWTLTPVMDARGKPNGLILSLVDATTRHRAELAVEANERNMRALLNATTESIVLIDGDGKILAANATASQRLAQPLDTLPGQNIYTLMPDEISARRHERSRHVLHQGHPEIFQDERDGRHYESSLYPVPGSQGQPARLAIYSADITERHALQEIDTLMLEVNQQVLRGSKLLEVLNYICGEAVRLFRLEVAWVGRKEGDGSVTIISRAGHANAYLDEISRIGVRCDDSPQGSGPTGSAIKTGQTQIFRSTDPRFATWMSAARGFGLEAVISLPLILRGQVFGAFSLYSSQPEAFDAPDLRQRLAAITSRIGVALEMAQDHEKLRLLVAALETASNAVFITDRSGRIQWINDAFTRMSGYTASESLGQNARLLKSGQHDATYYQHLWATLLAGEAWVSETIERHRQGHLYTVQQTITPIRDDNGEISHFISIHEDITARKKTEERIRHMAQYDALTNLPNRSLFFDHLQQMLALAKRNKHLLALLFLDLDGFKAVNDTLGHHAGDLLLKGVAKRLKKSVRASDIISRLGGDEFTVILSEITNREDASHVAEKIITDLGKPFLLDNQQAQIGASIGIAFYHGGPLEPDNLVKLADSAMYDAKNHGKNTFRFASQ